MLQSLLVDLPRLVLVTVFPFTPVRVVVLVDVPVGMRVAVNSPVGMDVLVAVHVLVLVCVHRDLRACLEANLVLVASPPMQAPGPARTRLPESS
ncbi:MAG TPA: hypothetical protein VMT17_14750 [Anaeromyxobacteraceae bacterium]|nr:hypothetical protein [Anaeromyxobacteraceae bacterium]